MTREEAKQVLQTALTSPLIYGEFEEAITMAIEALKAEPTKAVCDDCILHVCNYNKVDWDAPSAEAEQVTGKLKNPCDSLLTDDYGECKEQKSKLDLISRQAVAIKSDDNSSIDKAKGFSVIW